MDSIASSKTSTSGWRKWVSGKFNNQPINVKDAPYNAKGDGVTDDTTAIQAAINFAEGVSTTLSSGVTVKLPHGEFKITASLVIDGDGISLVGEGRKATVLVYTGTTGAAIQGDATLRNYVTVSDIFIRCTGSGADALDFTWFSYSEFKNLRMDLRESNQIGVFAKGNGLGTGPYYNRFDNIVVVGKNDVSGFPGQVGVQFKRATSGGLTGDGPNANNLSDFGRIAGLDIGFDIQSGNGNLFSNIQIEAVETYGFAFNNHGTPGLEKALANKVHGCRLESNSTASMVRFYDGAKNNVMTGTYVTSINSINWVNDSDISNVIFPNFGSLYLMDFSFSNIPANATTILDPITTSAEGGIRFPVSMQLIGAGIAVNRFVSGGVGSGALKLYRGGVQRTDFTFSVANATRFGGTVTMGDYDTSDATAVYIAGAASIGLQITTTADWNQTTADIYVQLVFVT